MGEIERLRRPVPERTGPIRNLGALARGAEPAAGEAGRARGPACPEAAASDGQGKNGASEAQGAPFPAVDLAYQVIDEYMRQGREAARQIATGLTGGLTAPGSFHTLTERLVRDGLVWMESLAKLWATVDPPEPPGASGESSGVPGVRVQVSSRAPAEVTIDLRRGAHGRELAVHALCGPNAETEPIRDVCFHRPREGGPWRLLVRVPDGQPPALYSGIVFDRADGTVLGTVAVRLEAEEARR